MRAFKITAIEWDTTDIEGVAHPEKVAELDAQWLGSMWEVPDGWDAESVLSTKISDGSGFCLLGISFEPVEGISIELAKPLRELLTALRERFTLEPWVEARLAELADPDPLFAGAEALGFLAANWQPAGARLSPRELFRGPGTPQEVIRLWWKQHEGQVGIIAKRLRGRLGAAQEALLTEMEDFTVPEDARPLAANWASRRARMANVEFFLFLGRTVIAGEPTFDFDALDARGDAVWAEIGPHGLLWDLKWLREAHLAEPEAWWTQWGAACG